MTHDGFGIRPRSRPFGSRGGWIAAGAAAACVAAYRKGSGLVIRGVRGVSSHILRPVQERGVRRVVENQLPKRRSLGAGAR